LEATMIIVDNSEYMRNGDFTPTRFSAQSDALNVIFEAKTQSNPENTVGIMSMAGKTPEVLVTPTQDIGKILSALHALKISGEADIATGVQIAQLALKHRQNKNQRQRIVVFVGSPLGVDEKSLVKLGKKLKKNNVSIDIVSFGEGDRNDAPLRAFVDSAASGDNCHLVSVPAGPHLLSDMIISSSILTVEGANGDSPTSGVGQTNNNAFEYGVDPSLDPELAMALRMSMQEEQARRNATAAPQVSEPSVTGGASSHNPQAMLPVADDDEEAQLAAALALSQADQADQADIDMADDEEDEEDEITKAISASDHHAK